MPTPSHYAISSQIGSVRDWLYWAHIMQEPVLHNLGMDMDVAPKWHSKKHSLWLALRRLLELIELHSQRVRNRNSITQDGNTYLLIYLLSLRHCFAIDRALFRKLNAVFQADSNHNCTRFFVVIIISDISTSSSAEPFVIKAAASWPGAAIR